MSEVEQDLLGRKQSFDYQLPCEPLDDFKDAEFEKLGARSIVTRAIKISRWMMCILIGLLLLLVVVSGIVLYTRRPRPNSSGSPALQFEDCGNSTEEARRNGCEYAFIPGAWLPKACHDAELEEDFLRARHWRWYADKAFQQELSRDEIKRTGGPAVYYVDLEYHFFHCAYTWKKLHRAVLRQTPIDAHLAHYQHTVHCADSLAVHDSSGPDVAQFGHIFTTCKELFIR